MSTAEFETIVLTLLKLGGVGFAIIHFFIGLILFRQIVTMRNIIKSKAGAGLAFLGLAHVVLLSIVIALIFFIPT
jgi:hypothetical protein